MKMRRTTVFTISLMLNCLFALSIAPQSSQTPTNPVPAQKPATSANEGEPEKNEVEVALEEAKKRGEPILAACLDGDCGDGRSEDAILKGKALALPRPAYPPIARAAHVSGTVTVQVIIGTEGNVIAAAAIDGHPLLQPACVAAARQARFSPTLYDRKPVKLVGVIQYNFIAQ
jgi:TonB family protein